MAKFSFTDTAFADEYFSRRAFASQWHACTEREAYLHTASMMIATYASFPESDTTETPEWLQDATCEQALYLLNLGKDPTQADKKTTLGVASTNGTVFDKSFAADILAPATVRIIRTNGGTVSPGAVSSSSSVQVGGISK